MTQLKACPPLCNTETVTFCNIIENRIGNMLFTKHPQSKWLKIEIALKIAYIIKFLILNITYSLRNMTGKLFINK